MDPGLCERCRHVRVIRSARSTFWHCGRAATDPRFAKYPRLPVSHCNGFEDAKAKLPSVPGPVAVLWSGGTDSCLARHRAILSGYDCTALVNMCSVDASVRLHAVDGRLIASQADALDTPLLQVPVTTDGYEAGFEGILADLRRRSLAGVVFGNVHLGDVQAWLEDRMRARALAHVAPLRGWRPRDVVEQFLAAGFRAVVVSVMRDRLDPRWAGHPFDDTFMRAVCATDGVDPCGGRGEYHTFVYDGPGFRKPVGFRLGAPIESGSHCITPARPVALNPD